MSSINPFPQQTPAADAPSEPAFQSRSCFETVVLGGVFLFVGLIAVGLLALVMSWAMGVES